MNDVLKVFLKVLFALLIVGGVVVYFLSSSCPPDQPFDFKTFKCSGGNTPSSSQYSCVANEDGTASCQKDPKGQYSSLQDCQKSCSSRLTYSCSNNVCVPDKNSTLSLEECQSKCGQSKYSCANNTCTPDDNGSYDTLEDCQANCKPPKYSCSALCEEDPNGTYSTQLDCINGCVPMSSQIQIDLTTTPPTATYQGVAMTYVKDSGHYAQFQVTYSGTGITYTVNVDMSDGNIVVSLISPGPTGLTTSTILDAPYDKNVQIYKDIIPSNKNVVVVQTPQFCNGRGFPDNSGKCACIPGYESVNDCMCKTNFGGNTCQYSRTGHCSGFGVPDSNGNCVCDPGHSGPSCQFSDDFRCNGHGKFDPNTGKCVCDPGYDIASNCLCPPGKNGPSCQFSRETTCNNRGNPTSSGGCVCDKTLPPNCTSLDGNCACASCVLDDASIPAYGGYSYQKFVLNSDKSTGCSVNPNPWAWADIVGVSAHINGKGQDSYTCLNSAPMYRYDANNNDYNACALTEDVLNGLSAYTSPISKNFYDFSRVSNKSLPRPVQGPYTRVDFNTIGENGTVLIAPPAIDKTNPYIQGIIQAQMNAIASTGHSPGDVQYVPMGDGSNNPADYAYIGAPF